MKDETVHETPLEEGSDEPIADGMKSVTSIHDSLIGTSNIDIEGDIDQFPILSLAEERAYIPPLDVALDENDQFDVNNTNSLSEDPAKEEATLHEKQKRHEKKKAKEERFI